MSLDYRRYDLKSNLPVPFLMLALALPLPSSSEQQRDFCSAYTTFEDLSRAAQKVASAQSFSQHTEDDESFLFYNLRVNQGYSISSNGDFFAFRVNPLSNQIERVSTQNETLDLICKIIYRSEQFIENPDNTRRNNLVQRVTYHSFSIDNL